MVRMTVFVALGVGVGLGDGVTVAVIVVRTCEGETVTVIDSFTVVVTTTDAPGTVIVAGGGSVGAGTVGSLQANMPM